MQDYQKTGMEFTELLRSNPWVQMIPHTPGFQIFDNVMCYWYDLYMNAALRGYYWPAFIAGSADNILDLFNPQTYSICKK